MEEDKLKQVKIYELDTTKNINDVLKIIQKQLIKIEKDGFYISDFSVSADKHELIVTIYKKGD